MTQINWHKDGTPGPWRVKETPDYAEIHCEIVSEPVALVGLRTVDACAIAEVPAMVAALRKYVRAYDEATGTIHCIGEVRAILARIDQVQP